MQEEWVISRVFQKAKKSIGPESKKTRMIDPNGYPAADQPASPSSSSVSLPPLFDSSPYYSAAATFTNASLTDVDRDNPNSMEHVSCFSTGIADPAGNASTFSHLLAPPQQTSSFPGFGGLSEFPSLRSLQENLQLPFFFPHGPMHPPPPPPHQPYTAPDATGSSFNLGDWTSLGSWRGTTSAEEPKAVVPPSAEADCMWTY